MNLELIVNIEHDSNCALGSRLHLTFAFTVTFFDLSPFSLTLSHTLSLTISHTLSLTLSHTLSLTFFLSRSCKKWRIFGKMKGERKKLFKAFQVREKSAYLKSCCIKKKKKKKKKVATKSHIFSARHCLSNF